LSVAVTFNTLSISRYCKPSNPSLTKAIIKFRSAFFNAGFLFVAADKLCPKSSSCPNASIIFNLFVIDISDIFNPFVLYTNSDLNFYHFYVYNNYVFAYITGYQLNQYLILDPTNSTGLDIVSIVSLPTDGWFGFTDFQNNLLYVHNYYSFELMIYNLTVIDQPVFISQMISSEYASVMGIAISNDYLVASLRNYANHSGLSVYNISNPLNPFNNVLFPHPFAPHRSTFNLYELVIKIP